MRRVLLEGSKAPRTDLCAKDGGAPLNAECGIRFFELVTFQFDRA